MQQCIRETAIRNVIKHIRSHLERVRLEKIGDFCERRALADAIDAAKHDRVRTALLLGALNAVQDVDRPPRRENAQQCILHRLCAHEAAKK